LGVELAYGVAGLGVGGGGYCAGVQDDDAGRGGIGDGVIATIEELAFEGGAVGLGCAAAELLDVEGGHGAAKKSGKNITQSSLSARRAQRRDGLPSGSARAS
jgi:hypothetical protein